MLTFGLVAVSTSLAGASLQRVKSRSLRAIAHPADMRQEESQLVNTCTPNTHACCISHLAAYIRRFVDLGHVRWRMHHVDARVLLGRPHEVVDEFRNIVRRLDVGEVSDARQHLQSTAGPGG